MSADPHLPELRDRVDIWRSAAADLLALARALDADAWNLPTDLAGWSVHDVMAHCAALESELAGDPPLPAEVDRDAPHIQNDRAMYTEQGVVARRNRSGPDLV